MVKYNIDDVTEGMVIGESIFSRDGTLLVAGGFTMQRVHIDMLKNKGVRSVMIHVEGTESVIPETIISQHVKTELAVTAEKSKKSIGAVFEGKHQTGKRIDDIISADKKILNQIIQSSNMAAVIGKLIDDILTEPWTLLNISKMREFDEGLFGYVVGVTVISLCIGHKYRLPADEMHQLGLGAFNYDIGMLAVPREILDKKTVLTDDESAILKQHTTYGYMMLSDNVSIPPTSSIVALSHHEHQDGSGFPRALASDNKPPLKNLARTGSLHRFAEIVAVADVYDMLVHGRPHFSPKLGPAKAIKSLLDMRGAKLNGDIVKTLVMMTPAYPVGTRVRITGSPVADLLGSTGVVAKVDPQRLFEPQILIYESKAHVKMKPVVLDLSKHKGFSIEPLD